jgi:cytochrome c oxidase assembly protein subunit 11
MRLLLMVVVMFAFGFALVPLYDVMCKAFGINGKTAGQYEGAQVVDTGRSGAGAVSGYQQPGHGVGVLPQGRSISGQPRRRHTRWCLWRPTRLTIRCRPKRCRASLPAEAAQYFHKTECFCFTQQVLQAGQRIEMPMRFIVDRDMPKDVKHLTLAYTLFDITARHPPVAAVWQ